MALGAVMTALVEVELGRSFVPFSFGGDADNILYSANDEQQERVPAADDQRRQGQLLRDHRARRRLGRAQHPDLAPSATATSG